MGPRGQGGLADRLAPRLRRHERGLAIAYLCSVALAIGLWLLPSMRRVVSEQAARLATAQRASFETRVDAALARVETGRWEEGERTLLELDRSLPARHVKHALAPQRAELLAGLARAELA